MVHISEISWSRLETPEQALSVDDTVQVKVIGIAATDKPDRLKIALSMKQIDGDPWETVTETVRTGEKVKGKSDPLHGFRCFCRNCTGHRRPGAYQ